MRGRGSEPALCHQDLILSAKHVRSGCCQPMRRLAIQVLTQHKKVLFFGRRKGTITSSSGQSFQSSNFMPAVATYTYKQAQARLPRVIRGLSKGKSSRFVVAGKVIEIHLVAEKPGKSYAESEYGATPAELKRFQRKVHAKVKQSDKAGKLHDFNGDIETLLQG